MTKTPLYVHLLLDRSGSMENCRDATIDAFNEYVNGLRVSTEVDARLSLTTFDSEGIDLICDAAPAAQAPELNRRTYVPRAMTPLFDAIGRVVTHTDKIALRDGEKVTLVILTDGQENASKEFTKEAIRKLLDGRRDDKGWLILFLGADIDAFAEAGAIGMAQSVSLRVDKRSLKGAMKATRQMQERFAKGASPQSAAYTDEERREAGEPKA